MWYIPANTMWYGYKIRKKSIQKNNNLLQFTILKS